MFSTPHSQKRLRDCAQQGISRNEGNVLEMKIGINADLGFVVDIQNEESKRRVLLRRFPTNVTCFEGDLEDEIWFLGQEETQRN